MSGITQAAKHDQELNKLRHALTAMTAERDTALEDYGHEHGKRLRVEAERDRLATIEDEWAAKWIETAKERDRVAGELREARELLRRWLEEDNDNIDPTVGWETARFFARTAKEGE